MLRKLLKHEWKAVNKVMITVNLGIVLLTIFGSMILSTDTFDNEEAFPLAILLTIFYSLSMITFSTVTLIYIYIRFYKNLFTAEGYLMHTLPVTRTQLFHSKLIVGYFWIFLNSMLNILSTAVLGFVAGLHFASREDMQDIFEDVSKEFLIKDYTFADIFGFPPLLLLLVIFLLMLTSCFGTLLMGYLSILLGQLMEKYRLAASIGFYMAIYLINQIITSMAMLLPSGQLMIDAMDDTSISFMGDLLRIMFPAGTAIQLALGIVFYMICIFLLRRKVNLE